jgi:hypothetical protein
VEICAKFLETVPTRLLILGTPKGEKCTNQNRKNGEEEKEGVTVISNT